MMRLLALLLAVKALGWSQELAQVLKQGEQVFQRSCATGYCHGSKGTSGGAPRLAGRGFDQSYISNTVTRGVPGTAMPAFGNTLSRPDLAAVVAYIASLNGIANPSVNPGPAAPGSVAGPPEPELSPEAARGRDLFYDAVRGFARCSTCHEVSGMGIPVATPINKVPPTAAVLRALATPDVSTVTLDGESMPALVVSQGKSHALFYDLTSVPPVLRTVAPAALKVTSGSAWRHSSVIGSYDDTELSSILAFLRVAATP
ncbi:MAG TPA: c-type cytochrome [Bryobacteraceae bacterium]|nr:c-type cytochrome [Bryobacteraceae bacterium]